MQNNFEKKNIQKTILFFGGGLNIHKYLKNISRLKDIPGHE